MMMAIVMMMTSARWVCSTPSVTSARCTRAVCTFGLWRSYSKPLFLLGDHDDELMTSFRCKMLWWWWWVCEASAEGNAKEAKWSPRWLECSESGKSSNWKCIQPNQQHSIDGEEDWWRWWQRWRLSRWWWCRKIWCDNSRSWCLVRI